jgi:hypothetical protein
MPKCSKAKSIWVLVLALFLAVLVFHLGPTLGFGKAGRVRNVLRLADGSHLILVQTRNSDLIEAYTVNLYRLFDGGGAEVCLVGFEESYWWHPSMRAIPGLSVVELRADGASACNYDTASRELTWNDRKYPIQLAKQVNDEAQINRLRLALRD